MLKKPRSKKMITRRPRASHQLDTEASLARSSSEGRKLPHREGLRASSHPLGQFPVGD